MKIFYLLLFIWSVRSGSIRNLESARVSIIGQLEKVSTDTRIEQDNILGDLKDIPTQSVMQSEIAEENEDELDNNQVQAQKIKETELMKSPQVYYSELFFFESYYLFLFGIQVSQKKRHIELSKVMR